MRMPQCRMCLLRRILNRDCFSFNDKTMRRTMKTKTIFKMPAFVLLMSAILFSTACQKENAINENTNRKGFALPVTLNVTRQGSNATTRASFDDVTKTLSFSAGDKLFLQGYDTQSSPDSCRLQTAPPIRRRTSSSGTGCRLREYLAFPRTKCRY